LIVSARSAEVIGSRPLISMIRSISSCRNGNGTSGSLSVVGAFGEPPVLVGDPAPPEDRHGLVGHLAVGVDGIDLRRLDHALVDPLVTEVEAVAEALARECYRIAITRVVLRRSRVPLPT
jgi:hypothetical protein